jgi:hypothetical protein
MHVYLYGHDASSVKTVAPSPRQRRWNKVRELLAAEKRGLETSEPDSPRVKPTLASSIGVVLR